MRGETRPDLSILVAASEGAPALPEALTSLRSQPEFSQCEVVLADGSRDGAPGIASRYPVRLLELPGANLPELKQAAVLAARADLVAFLDPYDVPEPGWIGAILDSMSHPDIGAVGGAVVFDGRDGPANRAAYVFEYGMFNPPLAAGPTDGDLPGNNVAYRRTDVIDRSADILAKSRFYKPFLHERLRRDGLEIRIDPRMRVRHRTTYRFLPVSVRRFHYGRCFGATRLDYVTSRRRVFLRCVAPAVPLLLVWRNVWKALRHVDNRRHLPSAGAALVGICVCWGLGEWMGYWFGSGASCRKFR